MDKAQGLEETVRRQEMVIERLESMINSYVKEKRLKGTFNDSDRALLSEHARIGPMRQNFRVNFLRSFNFEQSLTNRDKFSYSDEKRRSDWSI